jgi:6-pyruvoyltetrahydropterin/6-carboxytetrahydropterin synthase
MSWEISKEFEFDFGHRVWSQNLDSDLSCSSDNKCRHLHGHRGKVIVYLKSLELEDGYVEDFSHLGWFKKYVDDLFDHKMLLDVNDPQLNFIVPYAPYTTPSSQDPNVKLISRHVEFTTEERDIADSFVITPFVVTAENLAKYFYEVVSKRMNNDRVKVSKIVFYETPKSQATYYAPGNTPIGFRKIINPPIQDSGAC